MLLSVKSEVILSVDVYSGARARSGAPWVRKCGNSGAPPAREARSWAEPRS